jgi:hypothetical protein
MTSLFMIENFYHGLIKASKESALEGFARLGNLTSMASCPQNPAARSNERCSNPD